MKIKKVGVTGGIGSGKTTVCHIFQAFGIPVYFADERAKELMVTNAVLREQIRDSFGEKAYLEDGSLNRKYLAQTVFADRKKLEELNELVHPAVQKDVQAWFAQLNGVPYGIEEAALIYESGADAFLDKVIVVTAPREVRIERIQKRDGISREEIESRMHNQWPEEKRIEKADFIIQNDGNSLISPQVWDIHRKLSLENE